MITKHITLDVSSREYQDTVKTKKGNKDSVKLIMHVVNGTIPVFLPEKAEIIFREKKADGEVIYNSTEEDGPERIRAGDDTIEYVLTEQCCAALGDNICEIQILTDKEVLYTSQFVINVEDNLNTDEEVKSSSEFTELDAKIVEARRVIAEILAMDYVDHDELADALANYVVTSRRVAGYKLDGDITTEQLRNNVVIPYRYQDIEAQRYQIEQYIAEGITGKQDVLTDEDKQAIADMKDVSDLVPKTRTIAGINLNEDITAAQMAQQTGAQQAMWQALMNNNGGITELWKKVYQKTIVDSLLAKKQNNLVEGENIELTEQEDGTVRIDASGGIPEGRIYARCEVKDANSYSTVTLSLICPMPKIDVEKINVAAEYESKTHDGGRVSFGLYGSNSKVAYNSATLVSTESTQRFIPSNYKAHITHSYEGSFDYKYLIILVRIYAGASYQGTYDDIFDNIKVLINDDTEIEIIDCINSYASTVTDLHTEDTNLVIMDDLAPIKEDLQSKITLEDIPIGSSTSLGLVKTVNGNGVAIHPTAGYIYIQDAGEVQMKSRVTKSPITCGNFDLALKVAMTDGKGAEWSADEQANARARLGIIKGEGVGF